MHKKFVVPFVALALALGNTACKKDPETEPLYFITDDLEWDSVDRTAVYAQQFLNDTYSYLPGGFDRISGDFLAAAAGDAVPSRPNQPVEYYTNGQASVVVNPDPYWATAYAGIRRTNIFLANIDRVPTTAANVTLWKSEVRFMRAMLYFELVKRYGGVPLVADKVFTLSDNLLLPRNNYEECVSYIAAECDAIQGTLRKDATLAAGDWGRITQGAALALKGRLLLYAASPLFNGGQVNGAGALQGYPAADASRWQRALDANLAVINLGYFALNTPTPGLPTAYTSIFTTKMNKEIILAKQAANSTTLENSQAPIGYNSTGVTSLGYTSPTQEFVDAFPTLTGAAVSSTAPVAYTARDPRLDGTVFYNGAPWLSRPVQTFTGGLDRPGTSAIQTRTGYYLRKFLGNFATGTTYAATSHNFPIFRYAETLLNAAEAQNELGNPAAALDYVIQIRRRSGLTAGTNSRYGVPTGLSQDDARTIIRNERRIELSFEEHRFWDVRRWKTADVALSGPVTGVVATRSGAGTAASPYTFSYVRQPVSTLVWQPRLYYMPLPYDEVTRNVNLVQNPGW